MRNILRIFFVFSLLLIISTNYADTLHTILQRGYINVGMTGDYPPFSEEKRMHKFRGFDVIMAESLAQYLGMRVNFVKTEWESLGRDLRVNHFDIVMSGISITPARASAFLFSIPVISDPKVILFRCADKNRYDSWEKINRYGVNVVENKGGTNEEFTKRNLKYARIMISDTPQLAFKALHHKLADAMITDKIDAVYQQKKQPSLCIASISIATQEDKAYMMNKHDVALQKKVNQWLAEMKESGQLDQLVKRYLL